MVGWCLKASLDEEKTLPNKRIMQVQEDLPPDSPPVQNQKAGRANLSFKFA